MIASTCSSTAAVSGSRRRRNNRLRADRPTFRTFSPAPAEAERVDRQALDLPFGAFAGRRLGLPRPCPSLYITRAAITNMTIYRVPWMPPCSSPVSPIRLPVRRSDTPCSPNRTPGRNPLIEITLLTITGPEFSVESKIHAVLPLLQGGGTIAANSGVHRAGARHLGPTVVGAARRQSASGSGRNWKWKAIGTVPLPPSLSHGVRSPLVVQTPRPFHPAVGSSMRPSRPLA